MKRIDRCEVCGCTELVPALDLGAQPMCDDLVPIGSDLEPERYPLEIVGCPNCFTFHQAVQVEKKLLFPQTYHYRAALTADVLAGMRDLVESVAAHRGGLEGAQVLDVGCNDGSLLSIFGEMGAKTCGIEPTGAIKDALPKADWLHHGFFDLASAEIYLANNPKPDVITFTNVFAHIEDLPELLAALGMLMTEKTLLVIENHYLGAVADLKQFDTFYHEHPRTYSMKSFVEVARVLDRRIEKIEFPARYNGNIRVMIGTGTTTALPELDERAYFDAVLALQDDISAGGARLRAELADLAAQHGPLPAKAFPGRAAINVHCFGLDHSLIDATYERSASPKIGNYIPGTKIEIRDEAEFFRHRLGAPAMVNFAWHIHAEIERYMRAQGFKGRLIKAWLEP